MELPKIKKSEHGVLDGIKSKLGFANASQGYDSGYGEYGDDYAGDYGEYGDYGDYGEYGDDYAPIDGRADDAAGSRYDPYAPVTTRPARASHARSSSRGVGRPLRSSSRSATCAPIRRFPKASRATPFRRDG